MESQKSGINESLHRDTTVITSEKAFSYIYKLLERRIEKLDEFIEDLEKTKKLVEENHRKNLDLIKQIGTEITPSKTLFSPAITGLLMMGIVRNK